MEIRLATTDDYQAVRAIMNQVQKLHVEYRPDIYRYNNDFYTEEYFEEKVKSGCCFVAECDHGIVGVMELQIRHIESPAHVTRDIIFIDTMAVEEQYRGQGIGHMFFEKVKEIKFSKKLDGIELQVNARNVAAYEMYKKYGFTEKSINMELL